MHGYEESSKVTVNGYEESSKVIVYGYEESSKVIVNWLTKNHQRCSKNHQR